MSEEEENEDGLPTPPEPRFFIRDHLQEASEEFINDYVSPLPDELQDVFRTLLYNIVQQNVDYLLNHWRKYRGPSTVGGESMWENGFNQTQQNILARLRNRLNEVLDFY